LRCANLREGAPAVCVQGGCVRARALPSRRQAGPVWRPSEGTWVARRFACDGARASLSGGRPVLARARGWRGGRRPPAARVSLLLSPLLSLSPHLELAKHHAFQVCRERGHASTWVCAREGRGGSEGEREGRGRASSQSCPHFFSAARGTQSVSPRMPWDGKGRRPPSTPSDTLNLGENHGKSFLPAFKGCGLCRTTLQHAQPPGAGCIADCVFSRRRGEGCSCAGQPPLGWDAVRAHAHLFIRKKKQHSCAWREN